MALVERQLVSIDWDIRTLRMAAFTLRSKGGVRIRKVVSAAIPEEVSVGDPASFGEFVREVLHREGISARRMVVDVPRDQAVLNTLKLPAVSEDDLPAMVEFQIAKELPFPLADAVTDFALLDTSADADTCEVLVAAVRHDVLDHYQQTAEAAGLKIERIGLRPYANMVAVNEVLGETRHERVLFVDVGPVLTEIDVLRDGKLAFSRAASVMVPRLSSGEAAPQSPKHETTLDLDLNLAGQSPEPVTPERHDVVQALLREVTLTIEAYRAGDPGASMSHVVISGDTGVEEELLEAVRRRFDISGERYNPTACFGWDSASGAVAGGFAAVLGLALGHAGEGRLHFDFMHPKKTVSQSTRQLKKAPIAAAVCVLFILAGVVANHNIAGPKRAEIKELKEKRGKLTDKVAEYDEFNRMLDEVQKFEREQIIWVDELADVMSVLPGNDQIILSKIDMSQKERRISLKAIDCKDDKVANEARDGLDAFKLSKDGKPRFNAELDNLKGQKGDYAQRASLTIKLINRGQED